MSESQTSKATAEQRSTEMKAGVQAVFFRCGLYLFTVKNANPEPVAKAGNLPFPALHVCAGPSSALNAVEIVGSPKSSGSWLYNPGDTLVVRIGEAGATLILSSIRADGMQSLEVKVDRLDGGPSTATPPARTAMVPKLTQHVSPAAPVGAAVSLKAALYLKGHGDVQSIGADWLGRIGSKAWVESIAIVSLDPLAPTDLEYKGLSANGFETPWLSNGAICGTRDMGVPLIGLAFRLKPAVAAIYDCEYTGSFVSGARIGPLKNGVPCRSKTASDPLEAIQLRIVNRTTLLPARPVEEVKAMVVESPSFGKFREEDSTSPATPDTVISQPAPLSAEPKKKKQAGKPTKSAVPGSSKVIGAITPSSQRGSKVSAKAKSAITTPETPQKTAAKKKTK